MAKKPISPVELLGRKSPAQLRQGIPAVDILAEAAGSADSQAAEHLDAQAAQSPNVQTSEHLDAQAAQSPNAQASERSDGPAAVQPSTQMAACSSVGKKPQRVRKTVYLPEALAKRLNVRAAIEDREISEIVTEALERYFQEKTS
jgi:sRNA-binding protein